MRCPPVLVLSILAAAAGAVAAAGAAAPAAPGSRERTDSRLHRGPSFYFAVACGFSHRNDDDPIVYPGQRGRSHNHTYFGNKTTDAFSTPASLRGESTTCRLPADTAAYWAPTLFVRGRPVEPLGAIVYYVRRTFDAVDPFPAGLKVIAGNAAARSPQSRRVTFWSCGYGIGARSSTVATCPARQRSGLGLHSGLRPRSSLRPHAGLRLHVNFPDCWDGRRLDSPDHKSHMAYSSEGECPDSHPVEVPGISLVIYYGVAGGAGSELSSGGQFSGHADFVNSWDQRTLTALVDRYLNGFRFGHRARR